MLALCADSQRLDVGKDIHNFVKAKGIYNTKTKDELIIMSSLVNMYAKCGCLQDAQAVSSTPLFIGFAVILLLKRVDIQIFDSMLQRDVLSWMSMMSAYLL